MNAKMVFPSLSPGLSSVLVLLIGLKKCVAFSDQSESRCQNAQSSLKFRKEEKGLFFYENHEERVELMPSESEFFDHVLWFSVSIFVVDMVDTLKSVSHNWIGVFR